MAKASNLLLFDGCHEPRKEVPPAPAPSSALSPNPLEKLLHARALLLAGRYRSLEAELLVMIGKLDEKKIFRVFGYSSLFQYVVSELGLSEALAYNFINVSRKAVEVPQLKAEIISGALTVSKAKKITSVLNKANVSQWIHMAKTLPKPQLEHEVAKVNPLTLVPERSRYVAEKRLSIQCGVSEEVFQRLERVKDLLAKRNGKASDLESALDEMSQFFLVKHDPVRRAERKLAQVSSNEKPLAKENVRALNTKRPYIHAAVRHHVYMRDEGQCVLVDALGKRCSSRRYLDIHHIQPLAMGGDNSLDNLQLLCFNHHKMKHRN